MAGVTLTDEQIGAQFERVMNRLAKWRAHFTGWQLGTVSKEDPAAQAVRDHREATMFLRAEVSALAGLLIEKGIFTQREWTQQITEEAEHLMRSYEKRWPGIRSSDVGMEYSLPEAQESMKGWLH